MIRSSQVYLQCRVLLHLRSVLVQLSSIQDVGGNQKEPVEVCCWIYRWERSVCCSRAREVMLLPPWQ